MKYIFTSIFLGLALAFSATAQVTTNQGGSDNMTTRVHRNARSSTSTNVAPATTTRSVSQPRMTQRNISTAPVRERTFARTPRTNTTVRSDVSANARFRDRNFRASEQARVRNNATVNRDRTVRNRTRSANAETNVAVNRNRNISVNRERNFAANRNRNVAFTQRSNVTVNRNRNVIVTNNWRGRQFNGRQYAAFRNYQRTWHDRDWWRHHYSRIIFVSGGWWAWNAGYWYPAWGYDSSAYYPYDGPIYGYSGLTPDQIVVDVQTQLSRDGYYSGPIDGALGPMTRQAIAAFQADNGLAITSTVDEPTLNTLGLS